MDYYKVLLQNLNDESYFKLISDKDSINSLEPIPIVSVLVTNPQKHFGEAALKL